MTGRRTIPTVEQAFGQVIRRYRVALGISQEELGFRSGLHRTFVSQLERGVKSPSLRTQLAIARALKTHAAGLVRETELLSRDSRRPEVHSPTALVPPLIQAMLRLPLFDSLPGSVLEEIVAHVYSGQRTGTYEFADVVNHDSGVGWQVKSTRFNTPVTWKRAKLPNKSSLIEDSLRDEVGTQRLGDAIIEFCNKASEESVRDYSLNRLIYARLIDKMDGHLIYFEKELPVEGQLFDPHEFTWSWSKPREISRKEQLQAFHGVHRPSGRAWFAWHGLGENQLHFKGESAWWPPVGDPSRFDFSRSGEPLTLAELTDLLTVTSHVPNRLP